MKTHSTITSILALLATLSAAAPAAAPASPLLSGYGGPGQGNQAILGSALLNGSGGGGGSAGTGALPMTIGRANGTPNRATAPGQTTAGGPSKQATGAAPRGTDRERAGRGGEVSGVASSAYPVSEQRGAAQPSGTLGLSGEDLLYILLALATLAFAGVLTRRLTRTIEPEAPVAK
jgi:hypothetical protein